MKVVLDLSSFSAEEIDAIELFCVVNGEHESYTEWSEEEDWVNIYPPQMEDKINEILSRSSGAWEMMKTIGLHPYSSGWGLSSAAWVEGKTLVIKGPRCSITEWWAKDTFLKLPVLSIESTAPWAPWYAYGILTDQTPQYTQTWREANNE